MKKFLTFLALVCLTVTGVWAQWAPPFEAADSYEHITHWYALNAHSNQTHYLYTNEGVITQQPNANYETSDRYAWGFVGNATDGYTIYNKATGSSVALDSNNPCTLSAAGVTTKWTVEASDETTEKGRAGFCIKVSGQDYVNFQNTSNPTGNLKRWNSKDGGSTFTPYELDFSSKTYTVHITGAPAGTKVTYGGNQYADGETFSATGVSSTEITPATVAGYLYNITINGTDINVEYYLPPLTGITDIVENRVYTLESVDRGYFVYSPTYASGYISGSKRASYTFDAADKNFHFVFLQNNGNTYLYSLGAEKFATYASDGVATSAQVPAAGIALLASTGENKTTHPTVLRIDDSHQCNMSTDQGKGILTNWNSTTDKGNMLRILPVGELTTTELAAIKEVFTQKKDFTVTITGAPTTDTKVTYNEEKYGNGEVISAASVSKEEITPDTVEGYRAEVTVNGTSINVAYFELIKTNQLYVLSTERRGAWVVEGDNFMSTANASVGKEIDTTDKYQQFAIYEYNDAYYLWNEGAQHFISNEGKVVGIMEASPVAWSEEAEGTYFFHFTDASGKYININGSSVMEICDWSHADEGNKMHLTPVEGFNADAVADVITADLGEKTYTVTVTGTTDGRLIYNGHEYEDGASFNASGLSSTNISAKEIPGYAGTAAISGTTITVAYTAMPFAVGKTYRLTLRGGQVVYDDNSGQFSVGTITSSDKNSWFTIGGNSTEGYTLYNEGCAKYVYHADTSIDNSKATTTENEVDATKYIWKEKNGQSFFLISGTTNQYVNKRDNYFSTWKNDSGYGDAGSVITFEEVDPSSLKTYTYVLTDADNNEYYGTFTSSEENARPACVEGLTLTDEVWEDGTDYDFDYIYTATITFPFPVNKPTMIYDTFAQGYRNFQLKSTGSGITVQKNVTGTDESFQFTIVPALNDDVFTYTIADAAGNYIYTAATERSHDEGTVTLGETGTPFIWTSGAFKLTDKNLYLSVNSSNVDEATIQHLGVWDSAHNGTKMVFEEYVPAASYTLSIGQYGVSTLCLPENAIVPEDVTVYISDGINERGNLNMVELDSNILVAGMGYVVEGAEGDYVFNYTDEEYTGSFYDEFFVLMGVTEDTPVSFYEGWGTPYVLSVVEGQIGFYKFGGDTLKANRAFYLSMDSSINGFTLDFGGQTVGVSSVMSATNLKAGFDIQGRRINKTVRGINILNGKKIIK